jgi:glycyl-tRNA synthetase beta chain
MMQGRDLVFEIGTEELPSSAVYTAIEQLQVNVPKTLDDARLGYGAVRVVATPRRIAVLVSELADRQSDSVTTYKGPAVKAAFDAEGNPTPAAIGFARGKGIDVSALETVEDENGAYVYATVETVGGDAHDVLPGLLASLVASIEWAKSQRWGSGTARFSRPVRWLLALHGTEVVPVKFAGLVAGRVTWGHRFLAPGPFTVAAAWEYPDIMAEGRVVVDQDERARLLREGIAGVARELGGTAVISEKTFAEVVNLVESPTVTYGTFDAEFLEVPREILEHAMGSHQRYFPVSRVDGGLDNRFIVAHNGDPECTDNIVRGHQRVIRARLADAAFFYREDLATPLEGWLPKLESVVFQEKLGTTAEKVGRVERLSERVAAMVGAGADDTAYATRAAHLAKADLVTGAVIEFTDLQGVMGRYYALASGEAPEVALAIEEHYKPRNASDSLPASTAGRIVAIADKTDTICGIFAAGMAPKGTSDPFALRRNAIGILQMALDGSAISLDELIADALAPLADKTAFDVAQTGADIKAFFLGRLETILRDRGHAYDTVAAVLAVAHDDPADALARCEALTALRASSTDMEDLSVAFSRARNLAKPEAGIAVDRSLMGDEESALADALDDAERQYADRMSQHAYSAALEVLTGMRGPIDAFFENVMVMADDDAVRTNRLALLNRFVAVFSSFADFSKLSG